MDIDELLKLFTTNEWQLIFGISVFVITVVGALVKLYWWSKRKFGEACVKSIIKYLMGRKERHNKKLSDELLPYILKVMEDEMAIVINELTDHVENNGMTLKHSIRENNSFQDFAKQTLHKSQERLNKIVALVQENTVELENFSVKLLEIETSQRKVLDFLSQGTKQQLPDNNEQI